MERSTRQRSAIRQVLLEADRPLLATEVLQSAKKDVPSLGLATVYRTLKALVAQDDLKIVSLPGENPRFEFAHGHHHHFSCQRCGRVYDIHACPGNLAQLAPPDFQVDSHELTLYGTCARCKSEDQQQKLVHQT